MTNLLAALDTLVLERASDGQFVTRGKPPSWCTTLGVPALREKDPFAPAEVFPFLEIFLPDAENIWGARTGACWSAEFWTEVAPEGEEIHLEACALRVDERDLLVVSRNERLFAEKQLVLQRARELRLTHDTLTREMELKSILVHSIVHDLASPLHSILGSLSLVSELPVDTEAKGWADLALQAAKRQKAMIADILDVFSAEHGAMTARADAPDLAQTIQEVVRQAEPTARLNQVKLVLGTEPAPTRVFAEGKRLSRVLANLVANAIRHSPSGGRIVVSTERIERTIQVNVDDQGPGVPTEVLPHLFELFAGRNRGVAGTGLGLYFCRITVEAWGGGIGYERRPEGGSRFWIRLVEGGRDQ